MSSITITHITFSYTLSACIPLPKSIYFHLLCHNVVRYCPKILCIETYIYLHSVLLVIRNSLLSTKKSETKRICIVYRIQCLYSSLCVIFMYEISVFAASLVLVSFLGNVVALLFFKYNNMCRRLVSFAF